ncbi:MAG TPA: type II toxin-antitoxin system RelE/ParE family toxin [Allosphingosinicella sp.]|nr:type II toxin-antitoxin system RelE/ParE family toxin [Allosphingosinicella sp.]
MSESGGSRQVHYIRDASRALKRIDRRTARRICEKIDQLAADPAALPNNVSALKGGHGLLRLRVGGWRVIYSCDCEVLLVLRIAPRGSAYD